MEPMKKSNNLLLGLLALVIIGMFVGNVILKNRMYQQRENVVPSEQTNKSIESETDSIATKQIILNN